MKCVKGLGFLWVAVLAAFFALSACDDSSSAGGDGGETSTKSSNSNSSGNGAKSSNSSAGKVDCSALLEGNTGWSWDVPKECRFNPDIDYGSMTDERDGNVYRTVKIGDQVWMAENLNYDPGQGGSDENKYDWSWCYNNEPKIAMWLVVFTPAAAIDSANDIENHVLWFTKEAITLNLSKVFVLKVALPQDEWDTLFKTVHGWSTAAKLKAQRLEWKR